MDTDSLDQATMPDAAMMADPTMEDLFGEAADMSGVALPPAPLPASLILRIAELHSRGCCTKLVWSNTGSIARIAPDGSQISFRAMVRDKQTAAWCMSDESKYPIEAPSGRHFVHIQFSGIGIDLAAVDNVGTTHMYTLTGALGRMSETSSDSAREQTPRTELDAIVGMHWLALYPAEFRGPYVNPAVKSGGTWEAHLRQRDQHNIKAHHPAESRNAMLTISRTNEIALNYQNEGSSWHTISALLEPVRSSSELVSHADICEDGLDLLAITYDCSSRMRLYRIVIHWNASQHNRAPNLTYILVAPTLEVQHLTSVDNVRVQHADAARLSHLRFVPAVSEAAQVVPTLPLVVAIFTHAALPTDGAQNQGSYSAIARWRVESFAPTLHESFKKLKPGSESNAVLTPVTTLKRLQDVITNKIVLSFESQIFDTIFTLGASDGSLDVRDRVTMDPLQPFGEINTVSSLSQTGFEHAPGDHNLHIAVSADSSGMAFVRADGQVVARAMTFSQGWQTIDDGISDNKAFIEAAGVCLARQYAFLCYNNLSNDESLALLPPDASQEVRSHIVKMIFKMMNRTSPDISMSEANKQQMIVLKEPLVPRSLSAQLALGTNFVTGQRTASAQFAFGLLNLRLLATALAHSLIRPDTKAMPAETFMSMCGLIRWSTDLVIHMVDTLVNVKRDLEPGTTAKQAFERLVVTRESPVLHFLLCSFTRALLRFSVLWIGKYFQIVSQAVLPRVTSIAEQQELTRLLDMASKIPFRYHDFEQLIVAFDQAVRETWSKAGTPAERRGEIEISMMCDGEIPAELEPAINTLMDTILPKLIATTDNSKLYFWNTDWLGLSSNRPSTNHVQYDVIRKTPIPKGAPMRMCRRCGSVMEDLLPERVRELPSWLAQTQRHCVCMNYWILV